MHVKNENFALQEAESNRHCRRLQLKDIIPVETQRLTKYPLLLENIAKYTGSAATSVLLYLMLILYCNDMSKFSLNF